MSLRFKFSLFSSILTLLIILGTSSFLFIAEKNILVQEIDKRQATIAKSFCQVSRESLVTKDQIALLNYIKSVTKENGVAYLLLADASGKIIAHSDISRIGDKLSFDAELARIQADGVVVRHLTDKDNSSLTDIAVPVFIDGKKRALARVGFSLESQQAALEGALSGARKRIFGVAALALVFGLLGSFFLAHIISVPIKKMADAARLIGEGKLDTRISVKSKDELGMLARDLNLMAGQLKELDTRKSDFVASVTHELRSPLTTIGMSTELLLRGGTGVLSTEQKEVLELTQSNVDRLCGFVNDLLDVAKTERGKLEIFLKPVTPAAVLGEPVKVINVQAQKKSIAIHNDLPEGLPTVMADLERVQQVMVNLLGNAVKFTPAGGEITIGAKEEPHGFVRFSVRDTGIGIAHDQLSRIFEKFEQVKPKGHSAGEPKGTGLGLSIARAIVELHGGKIWVESKPDEGSCFYFTLKTAGRS